MNEIDRTRAFQRAVPEGPEQESRNLVARVFRFIRRWPIIAGAVIFTMVVVAIFSPLISPHYYGEAVVRDRNTPPVWLEGGKSRYLLGADQQGRDVLSRMIHGARISMIIVGASLWIGMVSGTALGLVAGYFGKYVDEVIMRVIDVWLAVPFIMIVLVLVVVVGQSFPLLVGVLGASTWAGFTRQVRGLTLSLRTSDYVALAKVAGASDIRIMYKHILPQTWSVILVLASLQAGGLILAEGGLSFLGLGVPPPTPSWGSMVADGRTYLISAWWISVFPGLAIFLIVMSFNFAGDWLRDFFDPRLRQQL